MWALYKLQAKAWIRNPFVKSEFITSILFLVVLSAMGVGGDKTIQEISTYNIMIIASITTLFVMNSAIYSFGFTFFEMKESVLLKRIGATKISKKNAVGSFVLWGLTTTFVMLVWISSVVAIASAVGPDVSGILYIDKSFLGNIDWSAVIAGLVLTAIGYLPIAFFFVSITKNSDMYNMLVTMYFFFFGFLGGAFTPAAGREWMDVISYMAPLGWTRGMVTNGMLGTFHWTTTPDTFELISGIPTLIPGVSIADAGSDWVKVGWVEAVMPLGFGLLAGVASAKTFKWDS